MAGFQEKQKEEQETKLVTHPDEPVGSMAVSVVGETGSSEAGGTSTAIDQAVINNLGERYEVQSLVGRGGMGAVYKVWDKQLAKVFAIKVLNRDLVEDKNSVKRFEQEATAAKSLDHPNLVAVYDYGFGTNGTPYIVMDYLEGVSLGDLLKREGFLDLPRALDVFEQVCEAIAYAHSQSVLHRDIKPNNIILTKGTDGSDIVKLVDFGIAKVLPSQQKAAENLTQTGDIFGSPLYMSPEQCLGNKLDGRSDLYEFGCVMYETITGTAAFAAENPIKIILKHLNDEPKPILKLPQDYKIPGDLDLLILKCLEKDPDHRYQTASLLHKDLTALRDGIAINLKPRKKTEVSLEKALNPTRKRRRRLVLFSLLTMAIAYIGIQSGHRYGVPDNSTPIVNTGQSLNPLSDAQSLDNLSYQYFTRGEYAKAIPLLQFGIESYKGNNPYYLADNYQHIGKCYLMTKQYAEAVPYYEKALKTYVGQKLKNYDPHYEQEARSDYAKVLRELGDDSKASSVLNGAYPKAP